MDEEEIRQLEEVKISGESVFDGALLHVRKDEVTLPDGKTAVREYFTHPGAVAVVPMTEDGCVILERQFRYPVGRIVTEIPAGKLDSPDEDRLAAAKRELKEETGYEAESWAKIGDYTPAAAYSDEVISLYLARDLIKTGRDLDEDEFINLIQVPLTEVVKQIMEGEITDGKTMAAIFMTARLFLI
ncbi:MAG: NUDIX hydrolase [Eubacterium sp.]|nr:NUDIX hydrolase [Eubacterium sp.]MBR3275380.1 NUDIX hydrolase [Eubacterium sp.]